MKKKMISLLLVLALVVGVCPAAFAAAPEIASPRAVSIPTQYAPPSWYNTSHLFTCAQYTYSSYIFSSFNPYYGPSSVSAWCDKPFQLELYDSDTNALVTTAVAEKIYDYYRAEAMAWSNSDCASYYIILRNLSNSAITSADNGYYLVNWSAYD